MRLLHVLKIAVLIVVVFSGCDSVPDSQTRIADQIPSKVENRTKKTVSKPGDVNILLESIGVPPKRKPTDMVQFAIEFGRDNRGSLVAYSEILRQFISSSNSVLNINFDSSLIAFHATSEVDSSELRMLDVETNEVIRTGAYINPLHYVAEGLLFVYPLSKREILTVHPGTKSILEVYELHPQNSRPPRKRRFIIGHMVNEIESRYGDVILRGGSDSTMIGHFTVFDGKSLTEYVLDKTISYGMVTYASDRILMEGPNGIVQEVDLATPNLVRIVGDGEFVSIENDIWTGVISNANYQTMIGAVFKDKTIAIPWHSYHGHITNDKSVFILVSKMVPESNNREFAFYELSDQLAKLTGVRFYANAKTKVYVTDEYVAVY